MLFKPSRTSVNRQQHIPPHIQQEINQHLQSTLPGHLQHYMNSGGYVPRGAQKAIAAHMQNMPAHLKQYSGAYMEQHVAHPGTVAPAAPPQSTPLQPRPPMPNTMRLDHSGVPGQQFAANFHNNLFAPNSPAPPAAAVVEPQATVITEPQVAPQPAAAAVEQNPYDFIVNPPKRRRSLNFLSGGSMKKRVIVVLGGGVVLIILIIIVSSLLSPKPQTAGLVSLTQQQEELVSVATNTASSQATQQVTQNLAASVQLSLTTSQQQLLSFLQSEGTKVSSKQLVAGESATVTQQLTNAAAASNFDTVYVQITQNQLATYVKDIKQTFDTSPQVSERQLLNKQYRAANLLLTQANSTASSLQSS